MKKNDLEVLLLDYIESLRDEEKTESTINSYVQQINDFFTTFDDDIELSKKQLLDYRDYLKGIGYKASTINAYIVAINRFYKFCKIGGPIYIKKNLLMDTLDYPDYRVKTIKTQTKTSVEEVLEVVEYKRLLRKAKVMDMQAYWVMTILATTGIRIEELKSFTMENLTKDKGALDEDTVRVFNKGKERDVPLPPGLRNDLTKFAKANGVVSGSIFPGEAMHKDGTTKQLHSSTIWRRLQKVASNVTGLKKAKVHAHAFRHMFAREYLAAGGNIADLADILGHEDINTTRIYNTSTVSSKRKQMAKMYK